MGPVPPKRPFLAPHDYFSHLLSGEHGALSVVNSPDVWYQHNFIELASSQELFVERPINRTVTSFSSFISFSAHLAVQTLARWRARQNVHRWMVVTADSASNMRPFGRLGGVHGQHPLVFGKTVESISFLLVP